jgi:CRP-like cAMP-binding protein
VTGQRDQSRGGDGGRDLNAILQRASLFEGLDEQHLGELVSKGRPRRHEPGQTVFLQGDRAEGLHIVLAGRVKAFKASPRGREQTLMLVGPGEPVGEVAVLSGEAYPASAEPEVACACCRRCRL